MASIVLGWVTVTKQNALEGGEKKNKGKKEQLDRQIYYHVGKRRGSKECTHAIRVKIRRAARCDVSAGVGVSTRMSNGTRESIYSEYEYILLFVGR